MGLAIFNEGSKFIEQKFNLEEDFEREVKANSKILFGEKTIYLDIKRRVDTVSLGGSIPDGILFDFEDPEDIKFYLVEIELSKHDFYRHIFPQITKFFAFYKNYILMNSLVEKIFTFISEDEKISEEFRKLSGSSEIYKLIKDSIENDPKILLIIDEEKPEFDEIMNTYTDTWDKFVIIEILKKYSLNGNDIFVLNPDFPEKELAEIGEEVEDEKGKEEITKYTESYHLEGTSPLVQDIYLKIKGFMWSLNESLIFNPQKYYISIRDKRNFAYLGIRKRWLYLTVMLPYEIGQSIVKNYKLRKYTEGIERFYGGPSFEIKIENSDNMDEIYALLKETYERRKRE